MSRPERGRPQTYLNPDYLAERPTGTCCWACARQEDCPMEAVGRRCTKDHTACDACTWWNERGCPVFAFDRNILKM
jgi:hypothetical protein